MGKLAAGVSHDFNNLLTVVLANLDVARFREGVEAEEALAHAAQAARSASELSRQLLDIGRANLGAREPVALAPIVREVLTLLDRSLPAKGAEVHSTIFNNPIQRLGHAAKLLVKTDRFESPY